MSDPVVIVFAARAPIGGGIGGLGDAAARQPGRVAHRTAVQRL